MPKTLVKIEDPAALSIIREIEALQMSCPKKKQDLEDVAQKEFTAFVKVVDAQLKEEFERLRMALSIPVMVSPTVTVSYLKCGVAFLEHGEDETKDKGE